MFDGEGRPVAALLRPGRFSIGRPTGREVRGFLRRLVRDIRSHWPRVEILHRADSHHCAPAVLDFCRAERVIARVEASAQGTDSRFVVTNLAGGSARTLYD